MADKTPADVIREYAAANARKVSGAERKLMEDAGYVFLLKEKKRLSIEFLEGKNVLSDISAAEKEINEILSRVRPELCPQCRGKGVYRGSACPCVMQDIYKECFGAEDVRLFTETFESSDLSLFDGETILENGKTQRDGFRILLAAAEKYAGDYPDNKTKNLLFIGATGLGKTFLCRAVASFAAKKTPVMYITAPALARVFLSHRLGEEIHLKYIWDAPLLIIDDLGAEAIHRNVTVEYLSELIDTRASKGRNTVFSTNLSLADLQLRYGERVSSRLSFRDIGSVFMFFGSDIRLRRS